MALIDCLVYVEAPIGFRTQIGDDECVWKLNKSLYGFVSKSSQLLSTRSFTHPDITMAASQCARYVHNPKRSHELALIQIGRDLKGTLDKGLIFTPIDAESLRTDVYVDAAFACGWGTELGTNPDSVKSRTGYIVEIANCPVIWILKLQTTIATSTMESEYTAMSMALRSVIPLLAVIESVSGGLNYNKHKLLTFKATVHKDNQGALILANLEDGRFTPRSKNLCSQITLVQIMVETKRD